MQHFSLSCYDWLWWGTYTLPLRMKKWSLLAHSLVDNEVDHLHLCCHAFVIRCLVNMYRHIAHYKYMLVWVASHQCCFGGNDIGQFVINEHSCAMWRLVTAYFGQSHKWMLHVNLCYQDICDIMTNVIIVTIFVKVVGWAGGFDFRKSCSNMLQWFS